MDRVTIAGWELITNVVNPKTGKIKKYSLDQVGYDKNGKIVVVAKYRYTYNGYNCYNLYIYGKTKMFATGGLPTSIDAKYF